MRHSFNVPYSMALQLPDDAAVGCLIVIQQQGITAGMSPKPYMLDTIISFQPPPMASLTPLFLYIFLSVSFPPSFYMISLIML